MRLKQFEVNEWIRSVGQLRGRTRRYLIVLVGFTLITCCFWLFTSPNEQVKVYIIKADNTLVPIEKAIDEKPDNTFPSATKPSPSGHRPPSFPKLIIPPKLAILPPKPAPICLVSSWGQGSLPNYAFAMFESVAENDDYVRFKFFHYKTTNLPSKAYRESRFKNIDFIDIAALASDGSYEKGGFPRFLADRFCQIFNETRQVGLQVRFMIRRFSTVCETLYSSMLVLESDPNQAPPIVQLRGAFGEIFSDFLHPGHCDAWAWIDMDVIVGNLKGWLDTNRFVWSTDIFTLSAMDWTNLYTRGQMTVHYQKRKPKEVNSVWRKCKHLSSIQSLSAVLIQSNLCLDEGCYGHAVLQSDVVYGIFPWQGNSWDSRHTKYMLLTEKRLLTVKGCQSKAECRQKLERKMNHLNSTQLNLESSVQSGSLITNEMLKTGLSSLQDYSRHMRVSRKILEIGKGSSCMWWIEHAFKNCIQHAKMPEPVLKGDSAWAIIIRPHLRAEMIVWELGSDVAAFKEYSVSEVLLYHFSHWKNLAIFDELGKESSESPVFIELSQLNE